jgi:hypothetical protein
MNTYTLRQSPCGGIYFDNHSPMYPNAFEGKINTLAGENITEAAPPLGGFFGNFVNTFIVKKDKIDIFKQKVLPNIGFNRGTSTVWDKDEEMEANLI